MDSFVGYSYNQLYSPSPNNQPLAAGSFIASIILLVQQTYVSSRSWTACLQHWGKRREWGG